MSEGISYKDRSEISAQIHAAIKLRVENPNLSIEINAMIHAANRREIATAILVAHGWNEPNEILQEADALLDALEKKEDEDVR